MADLFIHYLIAALRRRGFTDIVPLVGPFRDTYASLCWATHQARRKAHVRPENPPADTAGALSLAGPYLAERFLLLNGDSFFDFNLLDLAVRDSRLRTARRRARRRRREGRFR